MRLTSTYMTPMINRYNLVFEANSLSGHDRCYNRAIATITWAAISDREPLSLRMARPWPPSNDLSIAIAMKVTQETLPDAMPAGCAPPAACGLHLRGRA